MSGTPKVVVSAAVAPEVRQALIVKAAERSIAEQRVVSLSSVVEAALRASLGLASR